MILDFNCRNALVSFSSVILLFSALLILIFPAPSFADRILMIHQAATLEVGCDLSSGNDFIGTTKILTYDQPTKLILNCENQEETLI